MNHPFDPINSAIIQDNFGESADEPTHATINLSPEDVLESEARLVPPAPRRSKVLPVIAASVAILAAIGGAAYYVKQSAGDVTPADFPPQAAPTMPPNSAPAVEVADSNNAAAPAGMPATQTESAGSPAPAAEAPTPFAAPSASTAGALPGDLSAIAAGAQPAPQPAPQPAVQPAAATAAPVGNVPTSPRPAPAPSTPKTVSAPAQAVATAAPKPAAKPVAKAPVAHAPQVSWAPSGAISSGSSDAVKPLVILTAQQIGLRSITREGIVVASVAGGPAETYRTGSVLPSGERIENIDAASMVVVTDRNVIRIKP